MKKKIGYFGQDKIVITILKSLIAAILMGIATYNVNCFINYILGSGFINELISLAISVIIGVVLYVIMIILLKVEEVDKIINQVKYKIKFYKT